MFDKAAATAQGLKNDDNEHCFISHQHRAAEMPAGMLLGQLIHPEEVLLPKGADLWVEPVLRAIKV